MFTVDEATSEAIRRAVDDGGQLAGVVELRLDLRCRPTMLMPGDACR